MHDVVVLALPGTIVFDLATPLEVLGRPRDWAGEPRYRVRVAAEVSPVPCGPVDLVAGEDLDALDEADTIVLPGRDDPTAPVPDAVIARLRAAHARGARLVSICVGAFTLAATGLLDGQRATTHWAATDLLRTSHPKVTVDPDVLYVDQGNLLTSAGASAGVDLCLHLMDLDHGAGAAADAARLAVSPRRRDGGQAQYIPPRPHRPAESLEPLLGWLTSQSHRELTVRDIAARAHTSERTLNRRFREETGRSPLQWLAQLRVRRAQELLESSDLGVEEIARQVGFRSISNFRATFTRHSGAAPQTYRRTFRSSPVPCTQLRPGSRAPARS